MDTSIAALMAAHSHLYFYWPVFGKHPIHLTQNPERKLPYKVAIFDKWIHSRIVALARDVAQA